MSDKGLFFADSEDEGESQARVEPCEPQRVSQPSTQPEPASTPSRTIREKRLFLADSDDEDVPRYGIPSSAMPGTTPLARDIGDDSGSDIELPSFEEVPRASSVSSVSSGPSQRASSPPLCTTRSSPPPAKKRRLSPTAKQASALSSFKSGDAYLGSLLVGNAWSTVKGKGYIKPGDEIRIERDNPDDTGSWTSTSGKGKKKETEDKGKKKQLSLKAMLKPQPTRFAKRKTDTVVRLTNKGGFEFGRLPQDISTWVSKLLDMGMISFKGSTMVDCPDVLHSGADLIVSLSVYMCTSTFKPASISSEASLPPKVMFGQGQETEDEQTLRERKTALLALFDAVNLRPRRGAQAPKGDEIPKGNTEQPGELASKLSETKKIKTEIIGDGEEIEVEDGEELGDNELDLIYRKAQRNDQTMAEMDPPSTFTLTLRGYQKQALMWMQSMESGEISARETTSMHPLWSEYVFPAEPCNGIIDLTEDETPFYFNPYSGELSLDFPKAERKLKGGILADGKLHESISSSYMLIYQTYHVSIEMGMGKTIMLTALIHTNKEPEPILDDPAKDSTPTLIVAPTSLLSQWSTELQRSSAPGTRRDDDTDKGIPVVITSYGVLASEHSKLQKSSGQSSVYQIEWLRVILDEAHHCKSRTSKTARAVYALRARRRWAVTGTPIVNKLEDHAFPPFLDFTPWSDFSFFRSFITLPFLARDPKAIEIVQVILESILLRREKNMRDSNGNRIVELPAKEVTIDTLSFSPAERKIYDSIYDTAKRSFDQLNAKGLVGKNYTHILAMLMRLRRAVLHPDLVINPEEDQEANPPLGSKDGAIDADALMNDVAGQNTPDGPSKKAFAESVLANLSAADVEECPICLDVMDTPVIIPLCMHRCCKDCIISYVTSCTDRGEQGRCPTCSEGPIKENELIEVVLPKQEDDNRTTVSPFFNKDKGKAAAPEVILRRNDFRSSTKLDALIQNLRRLQDQEPHFRAVVFSQFTSFLSLISAALDREQLTWYRFDGSMDMKKRNAAISEFKQNERKPKILIVSLKAGGVGLNLTCANHVFMMDCWWNAATENQAIDRVHRIGQEKTVYVKHFIIENTVEGRILQIQQRKTAIVKEAFRGSDKSGPESLENLQVIFGYN
ncbi:P-loop containing nucleoside triphosphate hydrolase protein [Melanogaster broomeanus]|nr:P-loop containing nucleoside triphosphate hydrolase protein [Melanogaster broomeanus]